MTRQKGLMDAALYYKLIDDIAGKIENLGLHLMGESLIHPEVANFIEYAQNRGISTYLNTNGVLLNQEMAKKLFDAGLDLLLIDFDGDSPASYEKIRVRAKYNDVFENIKNALALQQEIRSRGHKRTIINLQTILFPGQRQNLHKRFSSEELRVATIKYKQFHDTFNCTEETIPHKRPCFYPWYQIVISWNGDVPICCVDYDNQLCLGNVKDTSIDEIWNSSYIAGLRNRHRLLNYQDIPMCKSCSVPNSTYFNPFLVTASLIAGGRFTRCLIPYAEKLLNLVSRK
jgi:radical SAM protein with 4Fe4S-binding SPASM domain